MEFFGQKTLPFKTAVTVAYVGSQGNDLVVDNSLNNVPAGYGYSGLRQRGPLQEHGTQLVQLRTVKGGASILPGPLLHAVLCVFKDDGGNGADGIWATPTPFAPAGYNRGLSNIDHTNILAINAVWDVPIGKGHVLGGSWNTLTNALIGGWELSGIYLYSSRDPLTFGVPGATLGNGWGTRPNLVGDPHVFNPSANLWFNPSAFVAPPANEFGSSGIGLMFAPIHT
jgi:hypothetical protein